MFIRSKYYKFLWDWNIIVKEHLLDLNIITKESWYFVSSCKTEILILSLKNLDILWFLVRLKYYY